VSSTFCAPPSIGLRRLRPGSSPNLCNTTRIHKPRASEASASEANGTAAATLTAAVALVLMLSGSRIIGTPGGALRANHRSRGRGAAAYFGIKQLKATLVDPISFGKLDTKVATRRLIGLTRDRK